MNILIKFFFFSYDFKHAAALWYSNEDNQKNKSIDRVLDSDTDMDDEDGDSEVEGSADQSLEF